MRVIYFLGELLRHKAKLVRFLLAVSWPHLLQILSDVSLLLVYRTHFDVLEL